MAPIHAPNTQQAVVVHKLVSKPGSGLTKSNVFYINERIHPNCMHQVMVIIKLISILLVLREHLHPVSLVWT